MKYASTLKASDLSSDFEALIYDLVKRIPFLEVTSLRKEERLSDTADRPDAVASVKVGNSNWTLIFEAKRSAQPREVRNAVQQLQRYQSHFRNKSNYALLLAPFVSEESAEICKLEGIGYADLAGNARITFDHVFIETRVAGNPFREQRESRSIFAPKATRVLRTLLQGPLRPWKVANLASEAQVSLGWVSAVRQHLLAHEWATEEAGGFRLTKPEVLLDAWSAADQWKKRATIREYSLLVSDPREIAERLRSALNLTQHAFTQWFAGWLRHPYTTPPIVTAYVERFPEDSILEKQLLARRVSEGARLRLVEPRDSGVFHPSQTVEGFSLVSDVQIYLDLIGAGQRGDEQAAELRKWPDFSGGWQ